MKAIMMSIKPQWVAKILNGEKTIEIRKKFPKDYVGWVYIYCTKEKHKVLLRDDIGEIRHYSYGFMSVAKHVNIFDLNPNLCGKVVAKVWCDKVEEIIDKETKEKNHYSFGTETLQIDELEKMSCLNIQELCKYIGKGTEWRYGKYGYAIHINNLEIFDKPKEISEFHKIDNSNGFICFKCPHLCTDDSAGYSIDSCDLGFENCEKTRLTRAPQSWCYIEI